MFKVSLLIALLLALAVVKCWGQSSCIAHYDVDIAKKSAYCAYYKTSNVDVSSSNTAIYAESDNWYAHASIYISSYKSIDSRATKVFSCEPEEYSGDYCSSKSANFNYMMMGSYKYVMVCLECHYWLGGCNFDYYDICTAESASFAYIPCDICS